MQDFKLPESLELVAQRQAISSDDVKAMRRDVFRDAIVDAKEAQTLISLNISCPQQDEAWAKFFVEALTDYCVHQEEPAGYINEENAHWLIENVNRDEGVVSPTELELLIKVLEAAKTSPERLVVFVLEQVKQSILNGEEEVGREGNFRPGVIGETQVDLVRRVLYAFGGDDHMAISRAEAEMLFDLNDASDRQENHVSWSDLFVKAIAGFMMAASGYTPPSREVALRREDWLEQREGVSGFMRKMVAGGLREIFNVYSQERKQSFSEQWVNEMKSDIAINERVTKSETAWLIDRIGRDGNTCLNERALVEFIKETSPSIHPSFRFLS